MVDALGDVGALAVDGGHDRAGVAVEAILGLVIADAADDLPGDGGNVHIAVGGNFTHDEYHTGGGDGLAGHAGVGVFFENGVQYAVRDLIADFIGMSLRYGFRCKDTLCHLIHPFLVVIGFWMHRKTRRISAGCSEHKNLIFRFAPPDLAPCACRLPGFIGPIPPPLLIRAYIELCNGYCV